MYKNLNLITLLLLFICYLFIKLFINYLCFIIYCWNVNYIVDIRVEITDTLNCLVHLIVSLSQVIALLFNLLIVIVLSTYIKRVLLNILKFRLEFWTKVQREEMSKNKRMIQSSSAFEKTTAKVERILFTKKQSVLQAVSPRVSCEGKKADPLDSDHVA